MKKMFLFAIVAFVFASFASAQTYSDLIISEYFEGTSNNKALEIYNGTGADVDLSQYTWKKETNGDKGYKDMTGSAMSGTLAAGKTFVIVNPQAEQKMKDLANLVDGGSSGVTGFNGNDAIALFKNGVIVDAIGVLGNAADWGKDVDMRRICEKGPKGVYDAAEWDVYTDLQDYSNLGQHCAPDAEAPEIKSAKALNATTVIVTFNEKVEKVSAETVANYAMDKSVTVSAAVLEEAATSVKLTISTISKGEEYALTVSNIKDLSDNVMAAAVTVKFVYGSTAENTCATIAEIFAKDPDKTTVYTITGPVEVVAVGSQRNQKWIGDSTGGILIDDPNNVIKEKYAQGDNMSEVQGTLMDYFGMLEFVPTIEPIKEAEAKVKVAPKKVTLAQIKAGGESMEPLMNALVIVEKVKFSGSVTFANGQKYILNDGTTTDSLLYTNIFNVDYIGKQAPTGMLNITGVLVYNREKYYITPRSLADMATVIPPSANERYEAVSFTLYPNPASDFATISIKESGLFTVSIFNAAGVRVEEIKGVSGDFNINLNDYKKGIYMIKVEGENKLSTTKLIKR